MNMNHPVDPIELFGKWHAAAATSGALAQPNAVCLSTTDAVGAAQARMVELKRIRDEGFVFGTSLRSPKSCEIEANPHVSLTFWWDHAGRQVRVAGRATRISDAEANEIFAERSRDGRLASWAFEQSTAIPPGATIESLYSAACERFESAEVPRPAHWSGYHVVPAWLEFLEFDEQRVHRRTRYRREAAGWSVSELQP